MSRQLKLLQELTCQSESELQNMQCILNAEYIDHHVGITSPTFFLDSTVTGEPFSAVVQSYKVQEINDWQLGQVAFLHFPEKHESIEIRTYVNPKSNNENILLWKTDVFSSEYYTSNVFSDLTGRGLTLIAGDGVPAIKLGAQWTDHLSFSLFNFSGKEVWRGSNQALLGSQTINLPRGLEIGMYILRVSDSAHQECLKLFVGP